MESVGEFEYSKKDLIGHGAFAVVFKGRIKKKPDQAVAIKCITKKNLAKSQNLLSKEIKILKELSDLHHENVVALMDCKETSHHVYLVMEYCNGGDLADFLQAKGTLSEDTISSFLRQIAAAMRVMVEKGIVHRDMKPQNLLLCNPPGSKPNPPPTEMILKIADFGFARFLSDGVMAATLCGSPMYMAPEVIMSLQYDAKADLWSVGTIVYQCLTGKAPFQAQTPQQLKQFYEKNANLAPNIPSGTSQELRHLLYGMLKRNAKDRIPFEEFFKHPFLNPRASKSSSPVPVPRTRSRSSMSESPASVKAVSASPLSTNLATSPPNPVLQRVREQDHTGTAAAAAGSNSGNGGGAAEPMEQGVSPQDAGEYLKVVPDAGPSGGRSASPMPTDDYVMVPENLPSDHSASSAGSHRPPSSVDLNAIFSDNSPDSPKHLPRKPSSGGSTPRRGGGEPQLNANVRQQTSPNRPSTLQVYSPAGSPHTSQPIPVPTQVKAYEQIQRSSSPSSQARSPSSRTQSPKGVMPDQPGAVPIPRRRSSVGSVPSVGSMSPPSVQFTIGTPPNNTWRKNSIGSTPPTSSRQTPPSNSNSPLRKSGTSPGRLVCTPPFAGPSSLPTIVGSPTKMPAGFKFPTTAADVTEVQEISEGNSGLLSTPFGHNRNKTCPDNIAATGYVVDGKSVIPVHTSNTEPQQLFHKSCSNSKLSEQLLKAAFTQTNNIGLGAVLSSSPSRGVVVPYNNSNTSLNHEDGTGFNPRMRRHSTNYDMSPTGMPICQSPPNMEGPISFVAPELAEETLMDKEHNETVAKLTFVLALVECIVDLAQSRSSPITESVDQKHGNTFKLENLTFVSESQRQIEQLVLHVRALQLLNSAMELGKQEIKCGRLQISNSVRQILKEMNNHYHQCLAICKHLHQRGVNLYPDVSPTNAAITADRLIYVHAIEMCQTAALDELFGNPHDCFRRYRSAQILLHSLSQQAHNLTDKDLLNKYKESVERRLYGLSNQGYIQAYDS